MSREPDEGRVAFYACFLRSGGVVSLAEWPKLEAGQIEALVCAGAVVAAERAGLVAQAILDLSRPPTPPKQDQVEAAMDRNVAKVFG